MKLNFFNNQGALEDGQEFAKARTGALIDAQTYAESNPYFAATTPKELLQFSRTMIPVKDASGVQMQNDQGQPLFETPERQVYLKNAQYIQGLEDKAQKDFERKVSNPLFKVGDFAADLFRNTVAAPINLLTGDAGFHVDPSKSAVTGYQNRLLELDALRTANHKRFVEGRDTRANAFANAVMKTIGSPVNTAGGLAVATQDADGTIGSYYVPSPDGSGKPLQVQRYEVVDAGNGVKVLVDRMNPLAPPIPINTAEDVAGDAATIAEQKEAGVVRGQTTGDAQVNLRSVIDGANSIVDIANKIRNHEGLDLVFNNFLGGLNPSLFVPNTPERNFAELLKQAQGTVFLQGFESVKGGGQITEVEGQKAEDKLLNLSKAQTKEQFLEGLNDFVATVMRAAKDTEAQARGDFLKDLPTLNIEGSGFTPTPNDSPLLQETTDSGINYQIVPKQ